MFATIFWAPLRMFRAWMAAAKRVAGEPGVRCGLCDAVPPAGECYCDECAVELQAGP